MKEKQINMLYSHSLKFKTCLQQTKKKRKKETDQKKKERKKEKKEKDMININVGFKGISQIRKSNFETAEILRLRMTL